MGKQGLEIKNGVVPVPGGRLYYEEQGSGPALVLVHAGIADSRMWDDQFQVFAQYFRTVRYDQRGFGQSESDSRAFSPRQDLFELLSHLKIDRAHLVGVSLGSILIVDFALEHPEMVHRLVPVSPGISGFKPEGDISEKAQYERERFTEMETLEEKKDHERLIDMELEMWVDGPLQQSDRVPAVLRDLVREMDMLSFAHPENVEWQRLDPPAIGRLGEIRAPTLVICGDLDTTGTLESAGTLAAGIPGARRVVIGGAAHMLNMEKPEEFNRIVLDFLQGLKSPSK